MPELICARPRCGKPRRFDHRLCPDCLRADRERARARRLKLAAAPARCAKCAHAGHTVCYHAKEAR